jgi:hypothetical protein
LTKPNERTLAQKKALVLVVARWRSSISKRYPHLAVDLCPAAALWAVV